MNNNLGEKDLLQKHKEVFWLFFFLLLFPPLPRVYFSMIFKIEFGIIVVLFFYMSVFFFLNKKELKYSSDFVIVILLTVFWGVVNGLYRGNQLYIMAKDVAYFFVPLLVYLLLRNNEKWLDKDFFSALFKVGTITSLVQIVFSLWGMFLPIDREVLRHVLLVFSTEIIPFLIVFRILQKDTIFDKKILLYAFALLLTKGRSDLLFLMFVFGGYYWWQFFRASKLRHFYIISVNIIFSFLWLFPIFCPEILDFVKASIKWRYVEWQSFFVFIWNVSYLSLLAGQGFGSLLPSLKPITLFLGRKITLLNKFHNIFLFLVFKLGVIGIIYYFLLSFFVFQKVGKCSDMGVFFLKILISFYFFILPVVHGGFAMSISLGIFTGFIMFLAERKEILNVSLIEKVKQCVS